MAKLIRAILALLVGVADKTNGKKTIIGLLVTAGGIVMFFVPFLHGYAVEVILAGLTILTGGLTHKAVKAAKRKKK